MKLPLVVAYAILSLSGEGPLHFKRITEIALELGVWKPKTGTPDRSMSAALYTDIDERNELSPFIQVAAATFDVNPMVRVDLAQELRRHGLTIEQFRGRNNQASRMAAARIAELVSLLGDVSLICYRPTKGSSDNKIVVGKAGGSAMLQLHVQSCRIKGSGEWEIAIDSALLKGSSSLWLVMCVFDMENLELSRSLWLIPALIFLQQTDGKGIFTAHPDQLNSWTQYVIGKRELPAAILQQLQKM